MNDGHTPGGKDELHVRIARASATFSVLGAIALALFFIVICPHHH